MNESAEGVPAQRVINSKGELSGSWASGSPDLMRQLLENEGIIFSEDGRVDLKRYGWDPNARPQLGRTEADSGRGGGHFCQCQRAPFISFAE